MKNTTVFSLMLSACCFAGLSAQEANHFVVKANKFGAEIQPTMYGHFFEDINYGADGGLYAELIKNRSFEFPNRLQGWKTFGKVAVLDNGPFDRNPHYVRLSNPGHAHKRTGLENEGFFGIGLKANEKYRFSVWAKGNGQKILVELIDPASMGETQVMVSGEIEINSADWKKYELVLTAPQTFAKAHLRIFLASGGDVDLEHVSLFPVDTWKGRENGLRKDLVQALVDTKPGVFRFPGGCIVEGTEIDDRYQWKNSVGPVENRPLNSNRWEYTFPHRYYPDYHQTYGMGFYELFLLSEDMGAEPLPIVNVGLACQYQNDDPKAHVPVDQLGNEQWGPEYPERLKYFVDAIRKAYPDIQIIGSSGPNSEGKDFDYLWPEMKKLKVDLVDEHFYRPEDWFLKSGNRYDNYDRKGPKVFAGEYACHGKGKKWNHFHASLLEAAFLTGVERNADVVYMATYAPLLAHVEGWQWRPDLIWFDNLRSVRSCSWHVQYLYGHNKGTQVVPLLMDGKAVSGQADQNGLFASAVWDEPTKSYIIKVVNVSDKAQPVSIEFDGLKKKKLAEQATSILFHSDEPDAENTLDNPNLIVPKESKVSVEGKNLQAEIGAQTFAIYRIAVQ